MRGGSPKTHMTFSWGAERGVWQVVVDVIFSLYIFL